MLILRLLQDFDHIHAIGDDPLHIRISEIEYAVNVRGLLEQYVVVFHPTLRIGKKEIFDTPRAYLGSQARNPLVVHNMIGDDDSLPSEPAPRGLVGSKGGKY